MMNPAALLPRIESREWERFYLAALAFVCVATSALISRAAGDTLFLTRLGSERLPVMYVIGAIAAGAAAYGCARASSRLTTPDIAIFVASVLIAANFAVYMTLWVLPDASRFSAYVLADLSGRIPVLLFWALATEIFDASESRRLFGLLGAAGTAACLPAGLLVGPVARRLGVPSLLLIVTVLLTIFMVTTRALQRHMDLDHGGGERRALIGASRMSAGRLHRQKQFVTIAALAAVTALVQTLVDYQFKQSFSARAGGADLAAIFGQLYASASVAALFVQLFLVHQVLRWAGVWRSLCVLPAGLIAASMVILQTASAGWVYATKAFDIAMTLTVNGAARQMLYRGIRSESRLQARAMAEGFYQPLAIAMAGSILALTIHSLTIRVMAAMTIAGGVIWIVLARTAYGSYVAGLLGSLRSARFVSDDQPFGADDTAVRRLVMDAMSTAGNEQAHYLAAVLPNVLPLAGHADPDVRWTVVRAAASGEFPTNERWLKARFADPHPRVRAFAAAGLINKGLDPAAGRAMLAALASSPDVIDRQAAAEGIGEVHPQRAALRFAFTPLLDRLLSGDDEPAVEAALDACRSHPDPALIPAVLPLLKRKSLATEAADALVAIGPATIRPITSFLRGMERDRRGEAVKKLARALGRKGDAQALPLLKKMLAYVDPEEQTPVFQAVADLVRGRPARFAAEIDNLIVHEARTARLRLDLLRQLGESEPAELLRLSLAYLLRSHIRHIFLLLDVRVKDIDMLPLQSTVLEGSREERSQVLELLHNLLPESVAHPLIDFLRDTDPHAPAAAGDPGTVVSQVLEKRAPQWVTVGALHAASRLEIRSRHQEMRQLLSHANPVIRETARAALDRVDDRMAPC